MPDHMLVESLRIDLCRSETQGAASFRATSPDWPGLVGEGWDFTDAVANLVGEVDGALPLNAETVAALRAAGGESAVTAWDTYVRGAHCAQLRQSGARAGQIVREYTSTGHSIRLAAEWAALKIPAPRALALEQAGMNASGFAEYWDTYWGATTGRLWKDPEIFSAEEWALARVPVTRAITYTHRDVDPATANEGWEPLLRRFDGAEERLELYLRMNISASEAAELEASSSPEDIVAGLETMLALRVGPAARDPWAPF